MFLALRRHRKDAADKLFRGAYLFHLRSRVVRRTLVGVGGTAAEVDLRRMPRSEMAAWLGVREDEPVEREHRVSVEARDGRLRIRITIFTELCVEVLVKPTINLSFDECSVRQPLPRLLPATVATAGNMLLSRPSPSICMVVTDRGRPIVPPREDVVRAALA
jgi:hypothetical protein